MSLSDCPRCWDTPCTCGHMGYTTIYHKNGVSINKRMDRLEAENAALKAEVARLASPPKSEDKEAGEQQGKTAGQMWLETVTVSDNPQANSWRKTQG